MTIEGKKILLEPIKIEDTDLIIKWRNNENVRKNFIFQKKFTREIHLNWLESQVNTGNVVQFIIKIKENNKAIGSVYFRDIDYTKKIAEYGIFIGEDDERGNGYGTEAAQLALNFAFNELNLDRIFLRVFKDNKSAIKTYEHAGFIYDRTETIILDNNEQKQVDFMNINNIKGMI